MSIVWRFTSLDDAPFFLNQSKGMSDIPSSRPLRQRYVRACILFSWLSLEEVLEYVIRQKEKEGTLKHPVPSRLGDKLRFVLHALRKSHSSSEFQTLRKIRNHLVHPASETDETTLLTQNQAAAAFRYCSSTIQRLCPVKVAWL